MLADQPGLLGPKVPTQALICELRNALCLTSGGGDGRWAGLCPPRTTARWLRRLPFTQALFVFMALSFARDEIVWLLRHADNIQKKSTDDFIDK